MTRRRRVYRSVVEVRRDATQKLDPRSCSHYHSTPEAATTCLRARVREALRVDALLIELTATIEYSHSRHDWFLV